MPSAHGPSFCRKELREKVGPIFSRTESAHTTDFLSQAAPRKNRTDFISEQKSAHTNRFSLQFFVYDKKSVRVRWALKRF